MTQATFMTHRGAVRDENQDAVLVSGIVKTGDMAAPEVCGLDLKTPVLLAVADGMGGHEGGALAAQIVVETLKEKTEGKDLFGTAPNVEEDKKILRGLLIEAAHRMKAEAKQNPNLSEMGAAVSGILLREKSALAFNCGDCRVYRLAEGCLERVTRDHSFVQELFEQGEISEEEMRHHPRKNIITSVISADWGEKFELYARELPLYEADVLFLCSDGVWEALSSDELAAFLEQGVSQQEAAGELFDVLMAKHCRDNVSFIHCCMTA